MSAWYYVVDGDPAFLTAEPADGAEPGGPISWPAALAAVQRCLGGAVATVEDGCFELPGLVVEAEPLDEDGVARGVGFLVSLSDAGDACESMARLVALMLGVAGELGGRVWSDDAQRWLGEDDVERARRLEAV